MLGGSIMKNYLTLVYLPDDEEIANYVQEVFEQKHVEVHAFEKTSDKMPDCQKDIANSAGLIILHISDRFIYSIRPYIIEIIYMKL